MQFAWRISLAAGVFAAGLRSSPFKAPSCLSAVKFHQLDPKRKERMCSSVKDRSKFCFDLYRLLTYKKTSFLAWRRYCSDRSLATRWPTPHCVPWKTAKSWRLSHLNPFAAANKKICAILESCFKKLWEALHPAWTWNVTCLPWFSSRSLSHSYRSLQAIRHQTARAEDASREQSALQKKKEQLSEACHPLPSGDDPRIMWTSLIMSDLCIHLGLLFNCLRQARRP